MTPTPPAPVLGALSRTPLFEDVPFCPQKIQNPKILQVDIAEAIATRHANMSSFKHVSMQMSCAETVKCLAAGVIEKSRLDELTQVKPPD